MRSNISHKLGHSLLMPALEIGAHYNVGYPLF